MQEHTKLDIEVTRTVLRKYDNNDPDPNKLPYEIIIIERDGSMETLKTEFQIYDFLKKEKNGSH